MTTDNISLEETSSPDPLGDALEGAFARLRTRVSEDSYDVWLAPLAIEREGDILFLVAPNPFHADWVKTHYFELLREALEGEHKDLAFAIRSTEGDTKAEGARAFGEKSRRILHRAAARNASGKANALDLRALPLKLTSEHDGGTVVREGGNRDGIALTDDGEMKGPPAAPAELSVEASEATLASHTTSATSSGFLSSPGSLSAPQFPGVERPQPRTPWGDAQEQYALNPRYRFEQFVVGPSNQLAHAAAVAASTSPGRKYNPLFIYSKVGLGKTHLVSAVGHYIFSEHPRARILFLSAERFTNEFIWALQNKRIDEFRARYRSNTDVLIIDDVQFLAGREQTQEEFFHTFNALYHADKQIIVTSDVYPQQIPEMQERLISRFQWGLVADIQPPELDTRIAIIQKKAEQERLALSSEAALVIAQSVQSNVRELEGTLLRLAMRAELEKRTSIEADFVREALGAKQHSEARFVSVEDVQRAVCEHFGMRMPDLKSDRRQRSISLPRMIAMYICRERLKLSYPDIGGRFGGKDHTTVMNAYKKIGIAIENDPEIRSAVTALDRKLGFAR